MNYDSWKKRPEIVKTCDTCKMSSKCIFVEPMKDWKCWQDHLGKYRKG